MNESCHIWMGHIAHTNESYTNESRYTHECVTSRTLSRMGHGWVMSYIRMGHITHTNESRYTYECVTSRTFNLQKWRCAQKSNVTHTNQSCHTHEWVMSHIWMSHVTHMNQSSLSYKMRSHIWMRHIAQFWAASVVVGVGVLYHTDNWVISHVWMCYMNESYHTYESVMSLIPHIWISHVAYECVIWTSDAAHTHQRMNDICIDCNTTATHLQHTATHLIPLTNASYECVIWMSDPAHTH